LSKFKPTHLSLSGLKRTKVPPKRTRHEVRSGPAGAAGVMLAEEPTNQETAPDTPAEQEGTALEHVGLLFTLLYVFFRFSFLHEFIAAKFNFDTHIIIILGSLCYFCALLSGRVTRAFSDKSTWMWLGFGLCMVLATGTSYWKGGSFDLLLSYLKTVLPMVVVVPAVVSNKRNAIRVIDVIGLACIATVLMGALNNDFKSGRMSIDATGSDIQDPNDYAAHLILMLPAMAYLTMRPGRALVFKCIGFGVLGLALLQILSTGSRGGFVSLGITAAYVALVSPKKVRLAILVGVPAIMLLALPFVPAESAARLSTLFNSSTPNAQEAAESSEARLLLLKESWKATLQHPILGVGPGIFEDYQANSAKENGQRGLWHVTHNAYTQVSSECGIPALIFYVAALAITFVSLRKVIRAGDHELSVAALVLTIMIVGFCVCIFFLSLAYNVHILVLSSLAMSMKACLPAEGKPEGSAGLINQRT
jgi:hypothetical protein